MFMLYMLAGNLFWREALSQQMHHKLE